MSDGSIGFSQDADFSQDARAAAHALPLDQINPAQPSLFQRNAVLPYFERLRREDPVHYCADSDYGPYWSITKYNDIMAVDTNHQAFSSEGTLDGISIAGQGGPKALPMFIAGPAAPRRTAQDGQSGGLAGQSAGTPYHVAGHQDRRQADQDGL